jgi:ribosomal-protein-serine acetyltransferase
MEKRHLPERIESTRIYLKKHSTDLAETMFQYVDEDRERLARFLPWAKLKKKVEDEVDYIKRSNDKWDHHEVYDYGIFSNDENTYMGNVGVHSISWANDRCEIGYWILGKFEGQGYVSEAVAALTNAAYEIGFNRAGIHCDPENIRSANIPKSLSFRFEARLTQNSKDQYGNYRDTLVFARLKSQGPIVFENRKTSPSNRPDFIKHTSDIQEGPESTFYEGTKEFLSIGSPFAKKFGLTRLGHPPCPPSPGASNILASC